MSWCLWQAFFAQTLQLSLPSEQLCADRLRKSLNFYLPSPVWPCMPGGVNWCSPNTKKTCSEHSTGQSCAMGAGSKGLEAFDGEEMMNVGAGAAICYTANRTNCWQCKVKCALDISSLSPHSASQTNLCLCCLLLVGLGQKQFKGKRNWESKLPTTIHKGLP